MMTNILYIEDDEGLQSLVSHALKKNNCHIQNVGTLSEAKEVYRRDNFDIALVDYELPDGKGIEFIREYSTTLACIILTGVGNESLAVKCINEGAKDYIVKDFQGKYLTILPSIINRVLSEIALENEHQRQSENLLKTQARLQSIFDNAPDLMMTTDNEFNIISVSEVISSRYQKKIEDIVRQNLVDLIDRRHVEQIKKNRNTFFKTVFFDKNPILIKCISLSDKENLIVFRNLDEHVKAQHAIEKLQSVETTNHQLKEKNEYLEKTLRCYSEKKLLGQSECMLNLRKIIQSVAQTETTVVINGETGTGKELVADAIVRLSHRSKKPMVTLNCATIPKELVESELFGHEKGAFTGALKQYNGKFSQADGGTLFLDEVGELDISTQAKLLRVLQEGEIQPVGSQKNKYIDVRVIAATHRNLEDMVAKGLFREDLFYRLHVVPIYVPPLRERKEDVVLLSQFFLKKYSQLYRISEKKISLEDTQKLTHYPWPGNVRELQNAIERFLILGNFQFLTPPTFIDENSDQEIIAGEKLPVHSNEENRVEGNINSNTDDSNPLHCLYLADVEKKHIEEVLSQCAWVVSGDQGAAKKLGLNPSTLRFKMKKLNIKK